VDKDWNVIVRPFAKIFNRFENDTNIPDDEVVIAVRKINGFLGCATYDEKHGLIISTTGSLDSEFAELARKNLLKYVTDSLITGATYLFEIVDETDPHIIKEEYGAYLIGIRMHKFQDGLVSEGMLDNEAKNFGCLRPDWEVRPFGEVLTDVQMCRHEGYVVYGKDTTLKLKSPFYLVKKLFSRVNVEKINDTWLDTAKTWIDEEYYPLVDKIRADIKYFTTLAPEQRRDYVETFIGAGL
jgi:hypothetical protein